MRTDELKLIIGRLDSMLGYPKNVIIDFLTETINVGGNFNTTRYDRIKHGLSHLVIEEIDRLLDMKNDDYF